MRINKQKSWFEVLFKRYSDFYYAWIRFREHQFIFPRRQVTTRQTCNSFTKRICACVSLSLNYINVNLIHYQSLILFKNVKKIFKCISVNLCWYIISTYIYIISLINYIQCMLFLTLLLIIKAGKQYYVHIKPFQ